LEAAKAITAASFKQQRLTLPLATSSLCAADADFTSATVAAVMALAASKICSSKFSDSSAS